MKQTMTNAGVSLYTLQEYVMALYDGDDYHNDNNDTWNDDHEDDNEVYDLIPSPWTASSPPFSLSLM